MDIRFSWGNLNSGSTAQGIRVYRATESFTEQTRPETVYANLQPNVQGYIDSQVEPHETYYYMFGVWRVDAGIEEEEFSSVFSRTVSPFMGPGSDTYVHGDSWYGYLGEVTQGNLITTGDLLGELEITGVTQASGTPEWLKFGYRHQALFVAKRPLVTDITYSELESKGLVDGTNTIQIGEDTFKVRLLKGSCTENFVASVSESLDPVQAQGSEWSNLFYSMFTPRISSRLDDWLSLNATALCGVASWCQEKDGSNALVRGNTTTPAAYQTVGVSTTQGWRPCLELVRPT